LVIEQGTKRPWNFLASLGMEMLVVSLALLIPFLYSDHLPMVHWRDVMVGPPPSRPPIVQPATHPSGATNATPWLAPRRQFVWNLKTSREAVESTAPDVTTDAPPVLGVPDGLGGSNNTLGRFIPNVIALPAPPRPVVEKNGTAKPLPVGGDVQMARLLRKVIPEYPALARSARISGTVRLIGIIGKDGLIQNLQIVSGHPMLTQAALEAVRLWVYKPTLLNGQPVEVIAPIDVNFTLGR
jgi:protein TonB